jgi:hypothetical protein
MPILSITPYRTTIPFDPTSTTMSSSTEMLPSSVRDVMSSTLLTLQLLMTVMDTRRYRSDVSSEDVHPPSMLGETQLADLHHWLAKV